MLFRKAILIIHGFAGGTYDQENLANYLQLNRSFDVYQFTLPGHNKNLSKVKYQEWIKESENKIEWLIENGYNNIYLIGHSMGGVIASHLATKYRQIKKLVLAAPAFHYLNVENDDLNIKESLKVAPKVIEDYGSDEVVARFLKLDISAIKEFMLLVKKYYHAPKDVICPVLILYGTDDHLVPSTSSEYVYKELNQNIKKLVYIKGATHDVFRDDKKQQIFEIVEKFLKYNTIGGVDKI